MTRDDLAETLKEVQPGQGARIPYEVFADLFPPGEWDDSASAKRTTSPRRVGSQSTTAPMTGPCGSSEMPKGPQGQKRPADVIGNAVRVMQIATGEAEEEYEAKPEKDEAAAALGRKGRRCQGQEHGPEAASGDRQEGG